MDLALLSATIEWKYLEFLSPSLSHLILAFCLQYSSSLTKEFLITARASWSANQCDWEGSLSNTASATATAPSALFTASKMLPNSSRDQNWISRLTIRSLAAKRYNGRREQGTTQLLLVTSSNWGFVVQMFKKRKGLDLLSSIVEDDSNRGAWSEGSLLKCWTRKWTPERKAVWLTSILSRHF